jgi:hypothetical protein
MFHLNGDQAKETKMVTPTRRSHDPVINVRGEPIVAAHSAATERARTPQPAGVGTSTHSEKPRKGRKQAEEVSKRED